MFAYLALFILRAEIRAALVTDFAFPVGGDAEEKSRWPHADWMRLPDLAETDEKETLTMQLNLINCVHAWRLDYPWGTLPGDDNAAAVTA